jgi:hypothetical protein
MLPEDRSGEGWRPLQRDRGERDKVGLVEFGSGIKSYVPLRQWAEPMRAC